MLPSPPAQPFFPPGTTTESLLAKPFHVYNKAFLDVLGAEPTFALISEGDALYAHEAAVWIPGTDDVFFAQVRPLSGLRRRLSHRTDLFRWTAQNAGGPGSGTGLNKSNVISKINLKEAAAALANGTLVNATVVPIDPPLEMTNGAPCRRSSGVLPMV